MYIVEKLIIMTQQIRVKHMIYWLLWVFCIINGLVFSYRVFIDLDHVKLLWHLGVPAELAIITGTLAIMCEHDNNDKITNQGLAIISSLILFDVICMVLATH